MSSANLRVVDASTGAILATGDNLLDLLATVKALALAAPPKKRAASVKLTPQLLSGFRSVVYLGESLSGFLRAAATREIAARRRAWDVEVHHVGA